MGFNLVESYEGFSFLLINKETDEFDISSLASSMHLRPDLLNSLLYDCETHNTLSRKITSLEKLGTKCGYFLKLYHNPSLDPVIDLQNKRIIYKESDIEKRRWAAPLCLLDSYKSLIEEYVEDQQSDEDSSGCGANESADDQRKVLVMFRGKSKCLDEITDDEIDKTIEHHIELLNEQDNEISNQLIEILSIIRLKLCILTRITRELEDEQDERVEERSRMHETNERLAKALKEEKNIVKSQDPELINLVKYMQKSSSSLLESHANLTARYFKNFHDIMFTQLNTIHHFPNLSDKPNIYSKSAQTDMLIDCVRLNESEYDNLELSIRRSVARRSVIPKKIGKKPESYNTRKKNVTVSQIKRATSRAFPVPIMKGGIQGAQARATRKIKGIHEHEMQRMTNEVLRVKELCLERQEQLLISISNKNTYEDRLVELGSRILNSSDILKTLKDIKALWIASNRRISLIDMQLFEICENDPVAREILSLCYVDEMPELKLNDSTTIAKYSIELGNLVKELNEIPDMGDLVGKNRKVGILTIRKPEEVLMTEDMKMIPTQSSLRHSDDLSEYHEESD